MIKKGVKKNSQNQRMKKTKTKTMDLLLENTITLQRTITDLAIELKSLNNKVSSLLNLFEEASKTFKKVKQAKPVTPVTETAGSITPETISKITRKMDDLAKQNRTIAKGLILLEKTVRENKPKETKELKPKPLPEFSF